MKKAAMLTLAFLACGALQGAGKQIIDTPAAPARWGKPDFAMKEGAIAPEEKGSCKRVETVLADGTKGSVVEIKLPSGTKEAVPYVHSVFPVSPDFVPSDARALTCKIFAAKPGAVEIKIPSLDWKQSFWFYLRFEGGGKWQSYTLPVNSSVRKTFDGRKLRGEIWFRNPFINDRQPVPVEFMITDIELK